MQAIVATGVCAARDNYPLGAQAHLFHFPFGVNAVRADGVTMHASFPLITRRRRRVYCRLNFSRPLIHTRVATIASTPMTSTFTLFLPARAI